MWFQVKSPQVREIDDCDNLFAIYWVTFTNNLQILRRYNCSLRWPYTYMYSCLCTQPLTTQNIWLFIYTHTSTHTHSHTCLQYKHKHNTYICAHLHTYITKRKHTNFYPDSCMRSSGEQLACSGCRTSTYGKVKIDKACPLISQPFLRHPQVPGTLGKIPGCP